MHNISASTDLRLWQPLVCRRALLAAFCLSLSLLLVGCSGGGIYANVGIAGPSVDLGPVSVHTSVNIGHWF